MPLGVGIVDPWPAVIAMGGFVKPVVQLLQHDRFVDSDQFRQRGQHQEGFFVDEEAAGLPLNMLASHSQLQSVTPLHPPRDEQAEHSVGMSRVSRPAGR